MADLDLERLPFTNWYLFLCDLEAIGPAKDALSVSPLPADTQANLAIIILVPTYNTIQISKPLTVTLGMGRNSSRIASRRIASNSREPTSYAGLLSDDEDDADWAGGPLPSEQRRKRKIKNNNSRKPSKNHKYGNKNK